MDVGLRSAILTFFPLVGAFQPMVGPPIFLRPEFSIRNNPGSTKCEKTQT